MTRHSLSKEARHKNAAEQLARFGLYWEVRGFLYNAPSIAATLGPNPNAYEIRGRIRRRRKGFTYTLDTADGHRYGHSIRTYELTYLDACEMLLEILGKQIERTKHALGGDTTRSTTPQGQTGPP